MTYEEAQKEAIKVEWVASPWWQGEDCWCRVIEPKNPIVYGEHNEEYYIVGSGSIPKAEAEYIVKLHNEKFAVKYDTTRAK